MGQSVPDESGEELWERLGLEELRAKLQQVHMLEQQFEAALRTLPDCPACARGRSPAAANGWTAKSRP